MNAKPAEEQNDQSPCEGCQNLGNPLWKDLLVNRKSPERASNREIKCMECCAGCLRGVGPYRDMIEPDQFRAVRTAALGFCSS